MASVTLSSGCTTYSISTDRHRDPIVSSYLSSSEKSFIRKLADSMDHLHLGRKKKGEDREIGVFGAEKYFNAAVGGEDDGRRVVAAGNGGISYQLGIDKSVVKPKNQPGTPSVRSESSWNSQIALLQQNVPRSIPPRRKTTKKRHGNGKSLFSSLGSSSCSCNGQNSVDTSAEYGAGETNSTISRAPIKVAKEPTTQNVPPETINSSRNKSRMINPWVMEEIHCKKNNESAGLGLLIREECFSFPILNSTAGNPAVKVHVQEQEEDDEELRKSLEVFGPPILDRKGKSFERRPAVSLWESKSRTKELEIPVNSDGMCDGDESDGSSDLFEIDSFTNNGGNYPSLPVPDGMSRSSCVTPIEASIEWSVVTASAVEISAMSDSEDLTSSAAVAGAKERKMGLNGGGSSGAGKEMEKRRAGILMSCKSYKGVRIAGDAHRTTGKFVPDPGRRHRSTILELVGCDSRKGNLLWKLCY
ncbi:hypothetical protein U1Q18_029301 [Sarracenia purpurea var. burkii]